MSGKPSRKTKGVGGVRVKVVVMLVVVVVAVVVVVLFRLEKDPRG